MAAPGLFPEGDRKTPPFRVFIPILLVIALLVLAIVHVVWANLTIRELENDRASLQARLAAMRAQAATAGKLAGELQRMQEAIERIDQARQEDPVPDPPPAGPPETAAPVSPPPPPNPPGRLAEGLKAFRAGRYDEAQVHFFRSLPDGYLPLALASLARGRIEDALHWLTKAMESDPRWLGRISPSELFGDEEEYVRLLEAMEARVRDNPLDLSAKLLLAYLHHEAKGAPFSKALLIEITQAEPGHSAARQFLETLEK